MSKIYVLMGKSASGKDELAKKILTDNQLKLEPIILYTTRPMREGEKNGREYFFISEDEYNDMKLNGKIIEERVYHTVNGDWRYFTAADDRLTSEDEKGRFVINTLDAFIKYRDFFGADNVIPLYIEVSPDIRMQRALNREKEQKNPNTAEVKRRFEADEKDFSKENLRKAGITKNFSNDASLEDCFNEIKREILKV